ncbi:ABC transporter permease [Gulosibacter macacae]|nr:ABC transporter permease [Gulosibacter macacae]
MSTTVAPSHNAKRVFNAGYFGYDLRRNLRMFTNIFFAIVLPLALYLIFGAMTPYADYDLLSGRGNISAQLMVSMATYGAITATVSLSGAAAVELQQGWGRQIGLTPFTQAGYVLTKLLVAISIAVLPIVAVFITGAVTAARVSEAWLWPVLGLTSLIGAVVFGLYGLMFGLLFRSESAVGAAAGLVVILMFAGNAFTPLSGFLFDMAPFTPVWGVMQLAMWPLTDGVSFTADNAQVQYQLWQPILNVVVWSAIFGALALWGARRHTGRA